MKRRAVSLTREIWLVMRSIQGLRLLADLWFDLPHDTDAAKQIPSALSASLAVIEARLLMLDRVVTGTMDPALFWCAANDAGPALRDGDEPDVHLKEWSAATAARRAREDLKRAKLRRQHERERRARSREGRS
jgi:hypothetical protein